MTETTLLQELRTGHFLMMQCAATVEHLVGHDRPAGSPALHLREAARMADLFARLGEGYGQVALLQARLSGTALDAPVPGPAGPKSDPTAPKPKLHAEPGAPRGRLKNGNPSGDFLRSPRCGARTRAGGCCRQPAMVSPGGGPGRCWLHGGLSTGPRTPEGLARCRTTRLVHGCRARAHLALRSRAVHAARRLRALARDLSAGPSAGHGVHRSDSIERKGAKLVLGRAKGRTRGMQSNQVASSAFASLRLCGESFDLKIALSAGHGVHRSFRYHLCSSVFIRGSQSFRPTSQLPAGHGVHRPDSPRVTTPAGLR